MQIFIQSDSTSTYDVSPSMTVSHLKDVICLQDGVSVENQLLFLNGHPLSDEDTLLGVAPLSTISLTTRVLGGKQLY